MVLARMEVLATSTSDSNLDEEEASIQFINKYYSKLIENLMHGGFGVWGFGVLG